MYQPNDNSIARHCCYVFNCSIDKNLGVYPTPPNWSEVSQEEKNRWLEVVDVSYQTLPGKDENKADDAATVALLLKSTYERNLGEVTYNHVKIEAWWNVTKFLFMLKRHINVRTAKLEALR